MRSRAGAPERGYWAGAPERGYERRSEMNEPLLHIVISQTWQIALLTFIVAVIVKNAARNRPHLAHALWMLVLIKCVTPPLWGHSLGVFSQLQTLVEPTEVAAETEDVNHSIEPIAVTEGSLAEDSFAWPVPLDTDAVIAVNDDITELKFDAEPQRHEVAEEAPSHIDPTSLLLSASASEIPLPQPELITLAADQRSRSAIDQLPILLFGGLIIGAVVTLLTMVIRCLRCLRQIRLHRTTEFDVVLRDRIQQLAKQLGIRRIPNIIVSDVLFGPAVLGLLRHTIVLPRCLFEGVDAGRSFLPERTSQLVATCDQSTSMNEQHSDVERTIAPRAVRLTAKVLPGREDLQESLPSRQNLQFLDPILAHELLHIRRGDLRTGTLQAIVQSLWWFHPAVWFCNRWLSREAERCCDEQVIAELGCTPAHYARSLLSVIECKHRLQPIPVFPGMKPVEITSQRMERIMSLKNGLKKRTPIWCWLMIVALAFVVLPGAVAKTAPDEVKPEPPSEQAATDTSAEVAKEEQSHPPDQGAVESATLLELEKNKQEIPAPVPDWIRNSSDPLVKLVWDARAASHRRLLMTDQRIPWLFMEGLAALRREYLIRDGNEAVVGLDWLQNGPENQRNGSHFRYRGSWFQKTEHGAQPDPRSVEFGFDDHAQEFVATLAMNDVPLDTKFKVGDGTITMEDIVKHLQMTVSEKKLVPWTLIALSKYLPRNEKWINAKGEDWSIERLVELELNKWKQTPPPLSLMSLAIARNQYFQAGETLDGIWLQADQRILEAIEKARPPQTSDGRIITTYSPNFQSSHFQYRSKFRPPISAQRMAPNDIDRPQMNLEGNRRIQLAALPTDIQLTNRAQMLLFLTIALQDNELGKDWIRREIEIAANDLVADWSNPEVRSPFYETTHALTVYLERYPKYLEYVDEAGLSPILAGNDHVQVSVKGMVRQPSSYKFVGTKGLRLLEVITMAGGPSDESADTVSVIRKVGKQPQPTVLQVNLKRLKSGADPNFYVMTGDEILVHPAEIIKQPLDTSIRLDDKFVLSADSPMSGDTVILFLNDRPITVAEFIAGGWDRLQRTQGVSDDLKRAIVCELIKSDLPQFVYRELLLQHFAVEAPEYRTDDSPQQREAADKLFLQAFESNSKTVANPQKQAQLLAAVLSKGFTSFAMEKKKLQLAQYTRSMDQESLDKSQVIVIRHVQNLVTRADLRRTVSLQFEDARLTDALRSIATDHGVNIAVKALHAQTVSRIASKPSTVTFRCKDMPLGDALNAIVEPFGRSVRIEAETVMIGFLDESGAMAKFRALPGQPSFAVYGIVKNTGWQKLDKEIRLLDAIELAGGVDDSDGVSIEITNPDIISGKAVPVSMSLRILQNDESGKLNRVIQDGDMIMVTQNGSMDTAQVKDLGAATINGSGKDSVITLTGTARVVEPHYSQNSSTEPDEKASLSTLAPGTHDASMSKKKLNPGRVPQGIFPAPDLPMPPAIQQSSDPLVKQVWQMRESTRRRLLSTDQQTPWQLMLGLNGLRRDFVLKHDGKVINGLEWIQTGPMFDGEPWFQKTVHGGQAHPYTNPYAFQGHINQFAATLAMCDVPLDAQFGTPDGPITMEDMVKNAQMTVNEKEEVCWTLQLLCKYLPPDADWENANGEKWNIERLVKVTMVQATPTGSPNGGTCGLFSLAVARNGFLRTSKPLEGVWLDADKTIMKHIQLVRDQRNPNGTLSSNFFRGREEKGDFDKRLASSGALLEFLMMAVSDAQLKEDWVRQAVAATVQDLEKNRKSFVSCSPLYGATNALSIFLDRVAVAPVVKIKSDSKDVAPETRMELCSYAVADLVAYQQPSIAKISRSTSADDPSPKPVNTAASRVAPEKSIDHLEANPRPLPQEPKAISMNSKVDFAPLTELIKATVQPESWDTVGRATIGVDEKTLSLVIRQTDAAHGEIAELLSQLRKAGDQMISISSQIVKLTDDAQVQWLGTQCSLHPLENGTQWALLSKQRSDAFTRDLLGQKPEVLSAPKVMTISGQTATIQVGQANTEDDTTIGVRLEMTTHLLPDTKVIRLQHAVQIGKLSAGVLRPVESLVGSGQTLLLLLDAASENKEPEVPTSKYLLLITPEYVPIIEEEEAVGAPQADAQVEAIRAINQ